MIFQDKMETQAQALLLSDRFKKAKAELLMATQEASLKLRNVKSAPEAGSQAAEIYKKAITEFNKNRGRDIFYPYISSGLGNGPYVELADGSVKLDMICGIGVNFFGHSHPELMDEVIQAAPSDVMQGNLQPGVEAMALLDALIPLAARGSKLRHGWITTCGTMANEIALKMIRQKKQPATKIIAFEDCFAGRSTAMQEITDNPSYRQGQPLYGEVLYLPFDADLGKVLAKLQEHITRYGDKVAALMIELVQGEGGFKYRDRSWYVRLFEEAKKAGLKIWVDEIQTFGRTGELFAFQKFELGEFVDVVTVAKLLQASVVLHTEEMTPKAGLVAGTFSASNAQLRTGRKVLKLLTEGGYYGSGGKIETLSSQFKEKLEHMSRTTCKGRIGEIRVMGGMIAFTVDDGSLEKTKKYLMKLFDLGVVAFYCGHGPILVRMLPPLGCMTSQDVERVCEILENTFREIPA